MNDLIDSIAVSDSSLDVIKKKMNTKNHHKE